MHDWSIGDLQFPVYCQELDDTEPAIQTVHPGVRSLGDSGDKSPQCAQCQPAGSHLHHSLLMELRRNSLLYKIHTSHGCGVCRPVALFVLPQEAWWEPIMRNALTVCCRNMWDSSVLIDNLNELEKGHGFQMASVVWLALVTSDCWHH